MSQGKKLYIAYGSNLNLAQMARRCPGAKAAGTALLTDHALLFRGGQQGAYATVEPCEGAAVPVLVWRITPKDERALDIYEGWPMLYEKKDMEVELDGERVSAMVYTMTPGHEPGYPSLYYYGVIEEGYRSAGFDTASLEEAVHRTEQLMLNEQARQSGTVRQGWGEHS